MPKAQPYKVDGEVGRFEFTTHSVSHGDEIQYNTGRDLFAELKGKELYRTLGFKEIAMIYGDTEESYRKTTSLINRIRYQAEGGTPYRTLQENTEQEGRKLIEYLERTSKCILQQNGFSEDGVYLSHKVPDAENQAVRLSNEIVAKAVEKCTGDPSVRDEILNNPAPQEDPENTVNISIDDVNVYIPCYALRKLVGLRNSSNIGKKTNDLVVSDRQKHNGMSWSKLGSVALASISSLKRNGETTRWFEKKRTCF